MALGWGIVGIGNQADRVMAPAIRRTGGCRLVAVASRDGQRGAEFAQRHGVARSYASYQEMLADREVGAIYVASPNALHRAHVIDAAHAGKHVLCEKPLALTVADARAMIKACRSAGVMLGVNLQNRFHPAHREMRRMIEADEVGELLLLQAEYSRNTTQLSRDWKKDPSLSGGGAIMSLGTHVLDLLRYLAGSDPLEVTGRADASGWDLPVDDIMIAVVRFPGRLRATAVSGFYIPRSANNVIAYGEKARLLGEGTVGMAMRGRLVIDANGESRVQDYAAQEAATESYVRLLEAFVSAADTGASFDATGQDGLELVRMVDALLESARTGRSVVIQREAPSG